MQTGLNGIHSSKYILGDGERFFKEIYFELLGIFRSGTASYKTYTYVYLNTTEAFIGKA